MAQAIRKYWLWFLWWGGIALALTAHPTSTLMAGFVIAPAMVATVLLTAGYYKRTMDAVKKRRGDA